MNKRHIFRLISLFLVLIILVLNACSTAPTMQPTTSQTEATQAEGQASPQPTQAEEIKPTIDIPDQPKSTTFIWNQEIDTLNPIYTNFWSSSITHQIWNCWAWDFDDQNAPHPVLVKEIPSLENGGISEDGRVITLRLRNDIVWSDGDPITSEDFLFTYQMIMSPNNSVPDIYPYDHMVNLETPDERTVVITFIEPFAPWLATLFHGLLPAHILRPIFEEDGTILNSGWNVKPSVSCGPYQFVNWQEGEYVKFEANQNYWLGKPNIDEVIIRFVPDEATQVQTLKDGVGDLGTYFNMANAPELEQSGIEIMNIYSGYNEGWFFNLDPERGHFALQDPKVREAIALALDRESIIETLQLGMTTPAISYWDNTPFVDPSIQDYPNDTERAKQLLEEAGWVDTDGNGIVDKNGLDMILTYGTTNRQNRLEAQTLAVDQLSAVGIRLEPSSYIPEAFFANWSEGGMAATGQLDIVQYSTRTNFPDPDTSDWLCTEIPTSDYPLGVNWSRLCDEELDALFQKQIYQVDFQERQQSFYEISKIIHDKVYWLGLWQDPDVWSISQRLTNVKISGVTPFYNLYEWDVTPAQE
jgi:peptide/nickel transport system substrate-binding protein